MTKNSNYWDASAVKLNKVNVKITKDTNSDVNLYENGDIELVGLYPKFVENTEKILTSNSKLNQEYIIWK